MRWFCFVSRNKKGENNAVASASFLSSRNISTDHGLRISGSEFNSLNASDTSTGSMERSTYPSFSEMPNNLRTFTYQELKHATKSFSRSTMIGEGGFGCVYRGTIRNSGDPQAGQEIAVKQLNRNGLQGHKEWSSEINFLGIADHPNLVKLIGYCSDDDERGIRRLLVYEFMTNGSVDDHLSSESSKTISWPTRLKIALDAARGLTYLHEDMSFQIIFRDFKTSNILLDDEWNAKLSDFGMARHGPLEGQSHVTTEVFGTHGYVAPDYIQTGRLTAKSDIWSYGVFLFVLITGRPPIDPTRPKGEQRMLEWIRPYISNKKTFRLILDPRLEGQISLKSAVRLCRIANKCLAFSPKSRPKMSQVLEMVKEIVDSIEMDPLPPPLVTCDSIRQAEKVKGHFVEERKEWIINLKKKLSKLKVWE